MNSFLLDDLVTKRTRAVVATGLYGDMHPHGRIQNFCVRHGVHYVNDAAQSMFATHMGVSSLATGEIVCLGFAENKPLPSFGTHGAILTDDNELYSSYYTCVSTVSPIELRLTQLEASMVFPKRTKLHRY